MSGATIIALTLALAALALGAEAFPIEAGVLGPVGVLGDAVVVLSFLLAGAYATHKRPGNRTGPLMMAVGVLWGLASLSFSTDAPLAHTAGIMLLATFAAPLAHLLLGFPDGRLRSRAERLLVAAIYLHVTVQWWVVLLFFDPRAQGCEACEPGLNLLLVWPEHGVHDALLAAQIATSIVLALAIMALLARRWRRATPPERRVLAPVLGMGLAAGLAIAVTAPLAFALPHDNQNADVVIATWAIFIGAVPLGFLAGLMRTRVARSRLADLVHVLRGPLPPLGVRDALARTLGDPSLEIGFRVRGGVGLHDARGNPLRLPGPGDPRLVTPLGDPADPVAVLVHDPALTHDVGLLQAVGDAAELALENERLHAEIRTRLAETEAARARLVRAGDDARRRIERDLHDGAQQSLVSLRMTLALLGAELDRDGHAPERVRRLLDSAMEVSDRAVAELRDLARGVYPVGLREDGLPGALQDLSAGARVPVELALEPLARTRPELEAAAFFVCSEAVTNAVKYAGATRVCITAERRGRRLHLAIADDGRGGAELRPGGGLAGLADRVAALGGTFELVSPAGCGTGIGVVLPWEPLRRDAAVPASLES